MDIWRNYIPVCGKRSKIKNGSVIKFNLNFYYLKKIHCKLRYWKIRPRMFFCIDAAILWKTMRFVNTTVAEEKPGLNSIPGRVSLSGLVHMQDTAVLNYSLSIGYSLCIPAM